LIAGITVRARIGAARMKRSRLQAEVVADNSEDDVGGVALACLEVAAAEVPVSFHVANDGFDGRTAAYFLSGR
jgi:hypothetical protein